MRIEKIGSKGMERIVGIAELYNSNHLKQKELIQLASSLSNNSLTVQLLNGLLVADEVHLLSAAQNALNAQQGNYMLSRSLDVEIIVFASTQRQIGRALDSLGVYDGLGEIAVVVLGNEAAPVEKAIQNLTKTIGKEILPPFAASSERLKRIKDHYQIPDKEIESIVDSEGIESQMSALSRCLVSRVSLVAFDT